ncbi:hypothetical protein [Croceicoccus gelatinilyticus]|uniref:hypothetical protein n=1 Tax=Croceicoccus gelatinilyticus TaxID=2835536 RepID=UPI001BD1A77D|nr:hypothetical protein [Croceicoccus gelatinilyticus]MBS7671746.1 hypothetical protein [Croceicoccus gelatinilyticus]
MPKAKPVEIEYASYPYNGIDKRGQPYEYELFLFYPDGKWDESKRTLDEALREYPRHRYEWKQVDLD